MKLQFTATGWADYCYWQGQDTKVTGRINEILKDAMRSPFRGIGKPEPLRGELSGWWSRRITGEHRLVYSCSGSGSEQQLKVIQSKEHY